MRSIATITTGDDKATINDRRIEFENFGQITTITASEVNLVAIDGLHISERIDIRTPLPLAYAELPPESITVANSMVTTGAIVLDAETGGAVLASSLTIFAVDTEALEVLYTPLVANAALVQYLGALAVWDCLSKESQFGPEKLGVPFWDHPSYWGRQEFDYAVNRMRAAGIYCNAGDSGLTAEFPWDEGAYSAMVGERTCLLRFRNDMPHPAAGNGLFFRLDMPISLEREQLVETANYLNVVEMGGTDTPPFFGAWCSHLDNGILTYIGFWPNLLYRPGTVANIASWCSLRSRIARQLIGNR